MRKFIKSASIILSALLFFQILLLDFGFAQKVHAKDRAGSEIISKSNIKVFDTSLNNLTTNSGTQLVMTQDNTPPTVPQNLSYQVLSQNSIELNWSPSTDDSDNLSYSVFRDDTMIATVTGSAIYIDLGLLPDTEYKYQVSASDTSNNFSAKSEYLTVTTTKKNTTQNSIKIQMYNADRNTTSNTIFPWFKIYNTGSTPVSMKDIKIRYYYSINGEKDQNFWCDWSSIGNSNVVGNLFKMPNLAEGTDYYLEISFKSESGVLEPGKSAELQCRIAKSDWTNYNQSDDYSFNKDATGYVDWNKITGYVNGNLVCGTEPIIAPQNIRIIQNSKSISLNWDSQLCATGYEVEVDGVTKDNGASLSYTHSDLIPGTKHTYRVRAKNQMILGPWSPYLTAITLLDQPLNVIKKVSETQINLSWDPVEGAQSYDLEINGSIINNETKTSYLIDKLEAGTLHTFRIRAKGAEIDGAWTDIMQIWTLPDIPTNILSTSFSTSITLTWDRVIGASGYEVEVYGTAEDIGDRTSYTHTGLEPNTQRTYRVRAKNSSGVGGWSDVIAATTLPASALNLQVQATDNSLKITWEAQAGALAYELQIDGLEVIELTENNYLHTGLVTNSEHTYRVRSKNNDGFSDWSESIKGVVLPLVPGNFRISNVTSSAIELSWDEVDGATGYDIEVDGKVFNNAMDTTFIHTALKPNEEYTYRVRAKNGATVGNWTDEIKKTTLLPAPTNIIATATSDQIELKWDMVVGAESYEVELDGEIYEVGSDTEYIHTGLSTDLPHTFRVRAKNSNGPGAWSSQITKGTLLGIPTNITSSSQSNSITIVWSSVDGASAYDVMLDGTIIKDINGTSYEYKELKPNSIHVYMVRAKNSECIGEWSKPESAFTKVGIPTNITTTSGSLEITVIWDEVDGADSYDIMVDNEIIDIGSDTVFKHSGLDCNSQHSYRVRAKNKNGEGMWSEPIIQLTGPSKPLNLKASAQVNQITLVWDKVECAVSYEVEVDGVIIKDILNENFSSSGLEPNTRHEYRVRSINKEGTRGDWSQLLEVNTIDELILKVNKDTGFNFVISVPKKEGIDSYDIVVNYNPEDIDVIDLYAITQKLELDIGKIEGTNISVKEFSDGKIVFSVESADKAVITIIRFMSKTNNQSKISYTIE